MALNPVTLTLERPRGGGGQMDPNRFFKPKNRRFQDTKMTLFSTCSPI